MLIIFDLDGTLIDSSKDLAFAMNATREYMGMPPLDPKLIYSYVGNGARVLVRRALGAAASEQDVERGVQFFIPFYRAHALEHTKLYSGVQETLDELQRQRETLAILTNKPVRITVDILKALSIRNHFKGVYGGDSFPAKKPEPVGILTLMADLGIHREDTWMVGDSGVDVETARNAGVRSVGVLWGFQPESLKSSNPDFLIAKPEELSSIVSTC